MITTMRYRHELRGWAKVWARVRRKPWAWEYVAPVEVVGAAGEWTIYARGPIRKEVVS